MENDFFRFLRQDGETEAQRIERIERETVEHHYCGSMILRPGLRLYEYNYKTGECRTVEIETKLTYDGTAEGSIQRERRVTRNPACIYFQALNDRNAVRKLVKMGFVKMVKHDGKKSLDVRDRR